MTKEAKVLVLAYSSSLLFLSVILASITLSALKPHDNWWVVGILSFALYMTVVFPKSDEIMSAFLSRPWKKSAMEIAGLAAVAIAVIIFLPGPF